MPAIQFPATVIVNWPTGPVPACGMHAQQLLDLADFLGLHLVVASPLAKPAACQNCAPTADLIARLENP